MSIEKKEAIYNIAAHGDMFSTINNMESDERSIKFYACDIPENVEVYTYTELGVRLACTFTAQDFICPPKRKLEDKNKLLTVEEPIYQFIGPSKFPNLFLHPDHDSYKRYYSGITYCNKNNPNENKSEVIYNIDDKKSKNCDCTTIAILKDKQRHKQEDNSYDCDKKYSKYYKDLLEENRQRCGPILLEEAIQLILDHSKMIYSKTDVEVEVTIKIYLHCCLSHSNLSCKVHDYLYRALTNKTDEHVANFNLDRFDSGFVEKLLTSTNTVDNIEDFNGTPIVQDEKIMKFRFNTTLLIITIDNIDLSESNTKKTLLEYKHLLKSKLEAILLSYLKIYEESDKSFPFPFPPIIKLSLESLILLTMFTTNKGINSNKTDSSIFDNGSIEIRKQLEEEARKLISPPCEDRNSPDFINMYGGRHKHKIRRTYKKTLRKKYKKQKKAKHIRRFTRNLKSKKHTKK
jgi:hypothetical protein